MEIFLKYKIMANLNFLAETFPKIKEKLPVDEEIDRTDKKIENLIRSVNTTTFSLICVYWIYFLQTFQLSRLD